MLNDMMTPAAVCKPRSSWCAALLASLTLAGAVGLLPVQAHAADKQTVSKEIGKTLQSAQTALKERKYSEAINKLKEAENYGKKTPWDQHVINVLAAGAYQGAKDYSESIKRYEALSADSFTSPAEQQKLTRTIATLAYGQGNYDKALEYGNKALKGGYGDDAVHTAVVQSYYQKHDYKAVQKMEEEAIAAQSRGGGTPKQKSLEFLLDACSKQGDKECQTKVFERLVTYYPQANYWENLLYDLSKTDMPDPAKLQLFRLMLEVNVLKDDKDYTEMAQLALDEGSPGEAQAILNRGFEKKVFPDKRTQDKNNRLLERAKSASAELQSKMPEKLKEAEAAPNGDGYVSAGYGYMGFGQYDKAIEALNKGLAKGGLKDNGAEARLLLGVAQFKSGHRDEAMKSFRAVKGSPVLERIGNLWALRAKQPESGGKHG